MTPYLRQEGQGVIAEQLSLEYDFTDFISVSIEKNIE